MLTAGDILDAIDDAQARQCVPFAYVIPVHKAFLDTTDLSLSAIDRRLRAAMEDALKEILANG
jgi:hypothetical protein